MGDDHSKPNYDKYMSDVFRQWNESKILKEKMLEERRSKIDYFRTHSGTYKWPETFQDKVRWKHQAETSSTSDLHHQIFQLKEDKERLEGSISHLDRCLLEQKAIVSNLTASNDKLEEEVARLKEEKAKLERDFELSQLDVDAW